MGVFLIVPAGAVKKPHTIFLGVSKNGEDFPNGSDGGRMYGPLVVCGPHGLKFCKPVYLLFEHSFIIHNIKGQ